MIEIVYLIIGIVVGVAVGWLIAKVSTPKNDILANELREKLKLAELNYATLESKNSILIEEKEKQIQFHSSQQLELKKNHEILVLELKTHIQSLVDNLQKEKESFNLEKKSITNTLEMNQQKLFHAEKQVSELTAQLTSSDEKLQTQKQEIEQLQKKFTTEFENIANKLLEDKSAKFTEQNKLQLDGILNPLKEKIVSFEKKVTENYEQEFRDKTSLKMEISKLFDLNQKISEEANNLATALKGNSKTQGNWGEMILERILETSGLVKDLEYKLQLNTQNENGNRLIPDAVIFMPDEKCLVIDSKVSLLAYNQYVNAEDKEEKTKFLKQHVDSIKIHIKGLSEKNYVDLVGIKSPDFVLLFIPIEASFSAALQADTDLYNFAWSKKIVIVSPTTLLATLRTVNSVWKQEKQIKNALKIAEEAGKMYDKFVAYTDDMFKVGKSLKSSADAYDAAMNKLATGTGSLVKKAQDLKELGLKTSKNFDPSLLERNENDGKIDELPQGNLFD